MSDAKKPDLPIVAWQDMHMYDANTIVPKLSFSVFPQGALSRPLCDHVLACQRIAEAFAAGKAEGRREAEREARDDASSASAEASWKERQGDEYGSY